MQKKTIFGILFISCSCVGLFVSLLFYISYDPSFRPWTHLFCDLGSGPLNAIIPLGIGLGLTAIFLGFLFIEIFKDLKKNNEHKTLINLYLTSGIIASITLLILGIFPLNSSMPVSYQIHTFTSIIYWATFGLSFICLGILEFSHSKFPSILIILGGISAIFFSVGFPLQEFGAISENIIVYLSMWTPFLLVVLWIVIKMLKKWEKS